MTTGNKKKAKLITKRDSRCGIITEFESELDLGLDTLSKMFIIGQVDKLPLFVINWIEKVVGMPKIGIFLDLSY